MQATVSSFILHMIIVHLYLILQWQVHAPLYLILGDASISNHFHFSCLNTVDCGTFFFIII